MQPFWKMQAQQNARVVENIRCQSVWPAKLHHQGTRQFLRRKDQTSASRDVLLDAIRHVAKSHSREIGKEVAGYVDDPEEQTSVHSIETLQIMGKSIVLDSQQSLSRIAADTTRAPSVRTAATKALSTVQ